jgi:cold shock CspA family protein
MLGKLSRIPHDKFFGFINHDGKDYFFHKDDFKGDWHQLIYDFNAEEEIVLKFEGIDSAKGPRASNVERV